MTYNLKKQWQSDIDQLSLRNKLHINVDDIIKEANEYKDDVVVYLEHLGFNRYKDVFIYCPYPLDFDQFFDLLKNCDLESIPGLQEISYIRETLVDNYSSDITNILDKLLPNNFYWDSNGRYYLTYKDYIKYYNNCLGTFEDDFLNYGKSYFDDPTTALKIYYELSDIFDKKIKRKSLKIDLDQLRSLKLNTNEIQYLKHKYNIKCDDE